MGSGAAPDPNIYYRTLRFCIKTAAVLMHSGCNFLFLFKCVFSESADGANPILGNVLPRCTGSNSVVGIAYGRVIFIATGANIFLHL
jgi:hypothetical protein